jgi:TRAP-type C4-dicarboxylate transport system substrate-binding protein
MTARDPMHSTRAAAYAAPLLAMLATLVPLAVSADDASSTIKLTIASSHSTSLAWVGTMHTLVVPQTNERLAARGSPYRIRWTEAYGGSLYKYENTLEAIEIGLTDMGWVGTLWELSKMPLQNVTYYVPFSTDDYHMIFQVFNDLHKTLPAMADAWTAQNQKFLGASALDTYHLMTNFPVHAVSDLKGRKILAPGPSAAWLEGTGAVAVDGGLTTYYTQIQTGVADGVLTILTGAVPYRIHEVAPYVTLVGLGGQVTGALSINLDTWNRLPKDVRDIVEELGPEYSKAVADDLTMRYAAGIERMRQDGATITELPVEEKLKWLAAMPDIATRWVEATERRGIPAGETLRAYMKAVREHGGHPLRDWDRPSAN